VCFFSSSIAGRKRALQPILVQAVRHDVRCRDQTHAILEQLFEQGREDHRVGDVGNEELVEADHPGFVGKALADDGQRVLLALERAHFFVHALHESVEVGARLLLERQRVEERIDQIGLATADAAPEIQALDRILVFFAEQFAEQPGLAAIVGNQIVIQALQMTHRCFLRGVVEKIGTFQVSLIALKRGHGGVWVVKRGRHFSFALGGWQFTQVVHALEPRLR
jgi:hypothetical protein